MYYFIDFSLDTLHFICHYNCLFLNILLVFRSPIAFGFSSLAKMLNSGNVFLVSVVCFLLCSHISMSSENFVSSFYIFIFLVLLCLLVFYYAVLTRSDNSGVPAPVSDFKGNTLSVSSVSMVFAGSVFINTFYQVKGDYLVSFYHAWEHLSILLLYLLRWSCDFFSIFDILNWVHQFSEVSCIRRVNSSFMMYYSYYTLQDLGGVCAHTSFAYLYILMWGCVCMYICFRCFSSVFMSKNAPFLCLLGFFFFFY